MSEEGILSINVIDLYSENQRQVNLPSKIFGKGMNPVLLKKVTVFCQMANKRSGTASTKNKSQVSGSGLKRRAQKGTGSARMGSRNMPHHRGGAVAFGPNGRSYERTANKKEVSAALFMALSEQFRQGMLVIVENLNLKEIKTKKALLTLEKVGLTRRSLFIDRDPNKEFLLSIRNLFHVDFLYSKALNALSIIQAKKVIMTVNCLNDLMEKYA
jgi:large subunit ribosomal protein L4